MGRLSKVRRAAGLFLLVGVAAGMCASCADDAGLPSVDSDEALDPELLDRSEPIGPCGYPGPGENGYGTEVGQRLADTDVLIDCEGEVLSFADFMCERDDDYGDYNRAILVSIGAGWCEPCKDETEVLMPEVYEPLHDQGLEIVQILFEDETAMAPTKSFCREWRDELYDEPLTFPVGLDQTFEWADQWLIDVEASTPVSMLIDANGNIRWKVEGQNPSDLVEQAQLVMSTPYGGS